MFKKSSHQVLHGVCMCAATLALFLSVSGTAWASSQVSSSLTVTDEPAPEAVYRPQPRASMAETMPVSDDAPVYKSSKGPTLVGRKIVEIRKDLNKIQEEVAGYNSQIQALQRQGAQITSEYYSVVAYINAELQSGTTPGNPELLERWDDAQSHLSLLSDKSQALSDLAADLAGEATKASYVLDTTQASFGLSGAVKEDHKELTGLEDEVNQAIVQINRLLNTVQDEISRRTSYLRTERMNLETLSLAIANGEFYGHSISNRLFRRAMQSDDSADMPAPAAGNPAPLSPSPMAGRPQGRRPLVVIRFDRPNVNYEQAVYSAVGQALEKYPAASFEVVAVSPSNGNPAEVSLAANNARANSTGVLRTLTQMGLPSERVHTSEMKSTNASGSEVHIFVQ